MVIVTGGDDQAVCVEKVELCDDEGSPRGENQRGHTTSGSTGKTSAGKRCGVVQARTS